MTNALTLAEIIRRRVTVEWHEAVALIRAVIAQLPTTSGREHSIPELHQIELRSTGGVQVSGGAVSGEPIRRVGQLLQAALGDSAPPVQLRLVVAQATAPNPTLHSMDELDAALQYYERPDRDAVLQGLYERAAATVVVESTRARVPMLDEIAPLPKPERSKPVRPPTPPAVKRRRRVLVLAAVSVLLMIGAAAYYVQVSGISRTPEVTQMAAKASEAVGSAVVSGISAATEAVGLGRLVSDKSGNEAPPGPAPVVVPSAPAPPAPSAASGTRAVPAPVEGQPIPMAAFDLEPKSESVGGSPVTEAPPAASSERPTTSSAPHRSMYTPEDKEIVPPVGVRPQLPRELPPDVRHEDLIRIDLIVSPDGTVETVKLVSSARHMHDAMWLSAIKAWQFQPALRDGEPVRYLKTVWIAPQ